MINGQKVWTSFAQFSQRCVLLTRTGSPETPKHQGITAFFVDMDSPASRSDHCAPCTVSTSSARSTSTTWWCPPIGCSASPGTAGSWPTTCCRSSGPPVSGSASPTCSPGWTGCSPTPRLLGRRHRGGIPGVAHRAVQVGGDPAPIRRRRQAGAGDLDRQGAAGRCRTTAVRHGARSAAGCPGIGRNTLAPRVSLLAGGHDLRRHRRDPTQHHRPPAPRSREE